MLHQTSLGSVIVGLSFPWLLVASFAGNRLKRFFSHRELDTNRAERHETIRITNPADDDDDEEEMEDGIGEKNMDVVRDGHSDTDATGHP
jgi:hypothetical protein